jgi:hypothetical protein
MKPRLKLLSKRIVYLASVKKANSFVTAAAAAATSLCLLSHQPTIVTATASSAFVSRGGGRQQHQLTVRTFFDSSFFAGRMSSAYTTERDGTTITVAPKNEADQSGLVVICHGLGDTAEGFAGQCNICCDCGFCVEASHFINLKVWLLLLLLLLF